MNTLFIQFFLAHIAGDFFLQPGSWVKDKEERKLASGYLYMHVMIHFLLVILVTGTLNLWRQAAMIAVLHLVIDVLKLQLQNKDNKRTWFFTDQLLHLLVLVMVWQSSTASGIDWSFLHDRHILIIATAVLFLLTPTSFIIKNVISKWQPASINYSTKDSLENAGQLIGIIERLMVMTFILLGKWEGVGFILAAKSVFRFGDLKEARDMKLTEYVLIGTFLSFGLAILTGLLVSLQLH